MLPSVGKSLPFRSGFPINYAVQGIFSMLVHNAWVWNETRASAHFASGSQYFILLDSYVGFYRLVRRREINPFMGL